MRLTGIILLLCSSGHQLDKEAILASAAAAVILNGRFFVLRFFINGCVIPQLANFSQLFFEEQHDATAKHNC